MKEVPIYVMGGFLEAGKTTMIRDLLQDPEFTEKEKTLLLLCEEGEVELSPAVLEASRTTTYVIENKEEFTYETLAKLGKKERPDRVIIEYNGTWPMADMLQMALPSGWGVAQIMVPVNAETFDMYISNMRQMMVDQLTYADLILFNRCTDDMDFKKYWRNIKLINRGAMLIFENANGDMYEMNTEDTLPFDVKAPVIEIEEDDFGIWYVDAMDNMKRYEGKTVHFVGMVYHDKSFPSGYFVPGRFAMTCCANDMRFMGFLCKSANGDSLKDEEWVEVTATVHIKNVPAYGGDAPVLAASSVIKAQKPKNEYVYLY